jgi:hypothetical protein
MKFRLFGGSDCSDALLAQLAELSNLPAAAVRVVVDYALDSMQRSASANAAGEAERDAFLAEMEAAGVNAMAAAQSACAAHEILGNIVRYHVTSEAAQHELSMLGLPRSVTDVIVQGQQAHASDLVAAAKRAIPRRPGIAKLSGRLLVNSAEGDVQVHLDIQPDRGVASTLRPAETVSLIAPREKLQALLAELVEARESLRA